MVSSRRATVVPYQSSSSAASLIFCVTTFFAALISVALGSHCGLQCWLAQLQIAIPQQPPIDLVVANLYLKELVCSNIQLRTIESLLRNDTLHVSLDGVGIVCTGDWVLNVSTTGFGSGHFQATANPSSNAQVSLALEKGPDGLASGAKLPTCGSDLSLKVQFSDGGAWDPILNGVLSLGAVRKQIDDAIDEVVCQQLKLGVETNLTAVLAAVNDEIAPYIHAPPVVIPRPYGPAILNLTANGVVTLVDYVANTLIGTNGLFGVNRLVNQFTNDTGTVAFGGEELEFLTSTLPLSDLANITLQFRNVTVLGLNSWSQFKLFLPESPQLLRSQMQLDTFHFEVDFAVNVTVNQTLSTSGKPEWLYEEGKVVIELHDSLLQASSLVALRNEVLDQFISAPASINPKCVVAALESLNFTRLYFNSSVKELQLVASGKGFEEQFDHLISNAFALLTRNFGPAIPAFVNAFGTGPFVEKYNYLTSLLIDQNLTCEPTPVATAEYVDRSLSFVVGAIDMGAFLVVAAIILVGRVWISKHLYGTTPQHGEAAPLFPTKESVAVSPSPTGFPTVAGLAAAGGTSFLIPDRESLGGVSREGVSSSETDSSSEEEEEESLTEGPWWTHTLAFYPSTPFLCRYLVPLLIFVNAGAFMVSNLGVGASVFIHFHVDANDVVFPSLFEFSLGNSIRDMWNAGVYPLSLLIAVFSGAWPYIKLLAMLLAWMLPTSVIGSRRREFLLMSLDALGKWSLVDSYVLVMMLVGFRYHLAPPADFPGTSMDVLVQPQLGFYLFLVATMGSLLLTHVILSIHRLHSPHPRVTSKKKKPLGLAVFKEAPRLSAILVSLLLLISLALLILGTYLTSFQFLFKGLAGTLLNFFHYPNPVRYSLLELAEQLPFAVAEPNEFWIRLLQVIFFVCTILFPILNLLTLLVLWNVPMVHSLQRKVFALTEILNAWSCLEVFVASLICAIIEMRKFVAFVIGTKCNLINEVLQDYFEKDISEAKCFDVITQLESGCWLLFAAAIVYIGTSFFVMRKVHKALNTRERLQMKQNASHGGVN